ncbi:MULTISPECIES: hypothetical protein [unclassified Nocardiopsis]|uniref:hypothetical protein n=1 Tax=unclassified Nocardiopsis TaxID=2649073 RepID=UPI0013587917|nr:MULTISPECIES: hypothetical protein [unclassified Nocardiopsis]
MFYTPLAPSGSWGAGDDTEGNRSFYRGVDRLVQGLYREEDDGGDEDGSGTGGGSSDPSTGGLLQDLGLLGPPFLRGQEEYEAVRDTLFEEIKDIENTTGMSGYTAFAADVDGHWHPERMVQLVLVGPEVGGELQHVISSCGRTSASPPASAPDCV